MKIRFEQLSWESNKKKTFPIYLVTGNDHWLVSEACQMIRELAKNAGFKEREICYLEQDSDRVRMINLLSSRSLFGGQRLVEIQFKNKLSKSDGELIRSYALNLDREQIVLISVPQLESSWQKEAWFNKVDEIGLVVTIWPLEQAGFSSWLQHKLREQSVKLERQAFLFLLEQVAGNTLAAFCEITKLSLIYGNSQVSYDQVVQTVAGEIKAGVFDLMEMVIFGNEAAVGKNFESLKYAAVEPILLLWSVVNELRVLIELKALADEESRLSLVRKYKKSHRVQLLKIYKSLSLSSLHQLLSEALEIDVAIKTAGKVALVWSKLEMVLFKLTWLVMGKSF